MACKSFSGMPDAEQLDLEGLRKLKAEHPDHTVVAYINTTSELKTECDVCVTSSSAVQICSKIENDKILFIPDPNLGRFVSEKLPENPLFSIKVDVRDILLSVQKMSKKLEKRIRRHFFLFIRNAVRK